MGASGLLIGIIIGAYVVMPLAMSIASIVIGAEHQNAPCSDKALVPLSTWLFVYGGVTLGLVVGAIVAVIMLLLDHPSGMVVWIIGLVLGSLFMLAWNIVGAVSLFRDSHTCLDQEYPLWAMTLAVLIVQWIGFVLSCCSGGRSRQEA